MLQKTMRKQRAIGDIKNHIKETVIRAKGDIAVPFVPEYEYKTQNKKKTFTYSLKRRMLGLIDNVKATL